MHRLHPLLTAHLLLLCMACATSKPPGLLPEPTPPPVAIRCPASLEAPVPQRPEADADAAVNEAGARDTVTRTLPVLDALTRRAEMARLWCLAIREGGR
jgi:hypothetical protein